jgi:hypothetical protein
MFENFSKLKQTSQKIIKKLHKPSPKDEKKNLFSRGTKYGLTPLATMNVQILASVQPTDLEP